MKVLIKKIISTLLSIIVLLSSMSFVIDEHYCGDMLMDVSYFGDADNCGISGMNMNSETSVIKKNNCCKDKITLVESLIFKKEKNINPQYIELDIAFFNEYSYLVFYKNIALEKKYHKDFSPPDIEQDIRVLHQTFLI
tara:strand:+ start:8171 stop:8584 length:414 start_codon:yes stop_codon:yes gene_type:complete